MNFIKRYFEGQEIEYPQFKMDEILPIGVLWWYVSDSFLNGVVNWTTVLQAYVLDRYTRWDEMLDDDPEHIETKEQRFERLTTTAQRHALLDTAFQDDVLILAKAERQDNSDGKMLYVFMWFDRDGSDCAIGRFLTDDSPEVVKGSFGKYVADWSQGNLQGVKQVGTRGPKRIPLSYFQRWIKS